MQFVKIEVKGSAQIPNQCPGRAMISILCSENKNEFQLLKHIGRYSKPKMEWDGTQNQMVCFYAATEWISKYKIKTGSSEETSIASSMKELSSISNHVRQKGFKADYDINPFAMVTFKQIIKTFTPNEVFVFLGLESTFEEDDFTVAATGGTHFRTAVINDRYLKSEDAATDTFVTGSSCIINSLQFSF